ncbi:MAG TPA: ABC transporter substrate-binding protein, partial [Opitutaceae bacterium]|nr:ABC transporter substrate-binding protein [Opitutaceae bacterium]
MVSTFLSRGSLWACYGFALFVTLMVENSVTRAWAAETPVADEKRDVVVRLPFSHGFQFAGYYAAKAKGYFRDLGLHVRLEPVELGQSSVDDVIAGKAEYGVAGAEVLLHRLQGKPVVLVTTVFQHSALGLLVSADSAIQTPADLAGRRVALGDTPRDAEIWAMLMQEGVPREDLQLVPEHWFSNEIADGEADAMAAYYANRPSLISRSMLYRALRPASYGVDFYGDGLFTTEAEVRDHPDRVRAMRAAVLRGWAEAMANPETVIQYMLDHLPNLDPRTRRERLEEEAVAV